MRWEFWFIGGRFVSASLSSLCAQGVPFLHTIGRFFNDTATTEIYTPLNTLSLHDALRDGGAQAETAPVVVDGNIVTSRGAGTALELGFELVRQLLGDEAAQNVRESVVWEH